MNPTPDSVVRKNDALHRYELLVDGDVAAFSEYNVMANGLLFTHTEVLPRYEGRGFSSKLIGAALDDVRRMNKHAIPVCPFVAAFFRKHAEYVDLLSEDSKRAYKIEGPAP